jgi:hypothetical protein
MAVVRLSFHLSIIHDSYTILIDGEESMRKHKGIK